MPLDDPEDRNNNTAVIVSGSNEDSKNDSKNSCEDMGTYGALYRGYVEAMWGN